MQDGIIYIFGVERRSGTNYLAQLFLKHPEIAYCRQPGEDHLMTASATLINYVEEVGKKWSAKWKGMDKTLYKEALLKSLSVGLSNYLGWPDDKLILTKTPCTVGIENFFTFFPQGKAIILVRDGRNLVESGVQSFGWRYEDAFLWWRDSCRRILAFMEAHGSDQKNVILVKYEDLNSNTEQEMKRVFDHFSIPHDEYPFDEIQAVPVIGSSIQSVTKEKIDWSKNVQKGADFRPNERFENWSHKLKMNYNLSCGEMAVKFGYSTFPESDGIFKSLFKLK